MSRKHMCSFSLHHRETCIVFVFIANSYTMYWLSHLKTIVQMQGQADGCCLPMEQSQSKQTNRTCKHLRNQGQYY